MRSNECLCGFAQIAYFAQFYNVIQRMHRFQVLPEGLFQSNSRPAAVLAVQSSRFQPFDDGFPVLTLAWAYRTNGLGLIRFSPSPPPGNLIDSSPDINSGLA
jgi:hypothetical protein